LFPNISDITVRNIPSERLFSGLSHPTMAIAAMESLSDRHEKKHKMVGSSFGLGQVGVHWEVQFLAQLRHLWPAAWAWAPRVEVPGLVEPVGSQPNGFRKKFALPQNPNQTTDMDKESKKK